MPPWMGVSSHWNGLHGVSSDTGNEIFEFVCSLLKDTPSQLAPYLSSWNRSLGTGQLSLASFRNPLPATAPTCTSSLEKRSAEGHSWAFFSDFPGGSDSKEPACNAVRSLGWKDPLEKEVATHSSILAWRIPRTEEPGGLKSLMWLSD